MTIGEYMKMKHPHPVEMYKGITKDGKRAFIATCAICFWIYEETESNSFMQEEED